MGFVPYQIIILRSYKVNLCPTNWTYTTRLSAVGVRGAVAKRWPHVQKPLFRTLADILGVNHENCL